MRLPGCSTVIAEQKEVQCKEIDFVRPERDLSTSETIQKRRRRVDEEIERLFDHPDHRRLRYSLLRARH
jgi:hypothetical protein